MGRPWRELRIRIVAAVVAAGAGAAPTVAQTIESVESAQETGFTVGLAIHPAVARLPPPDFFNEVVSVSMAISGRSDEAQRHVLQGIALINASWDFEAYRHFCEAARADPDCIMAYWGIALALAAPNSEFMEQRVIAVERMLDLMEAGVGTEVEREFALALATLFAANAEASSKAFARLAGKYPGNLQARLLAAYMKRGGYDEFGDPTVGQEDAIKEMRVFLNQNPEDIGVLTFWAMLHAEDPDVIEKLPKKVLPFVRKIARLAPSFPPHQHLLGHFEWRCGNHHLAEEAFRRASGLYAAHMKAHQLSFHDCDGWVRSRLYLATALHSQGRFEEAMKVAKEVAALEIEEKRLGSTGANLVLWEGRTLPARLYLARGQAGDFDQAIASLPGKDDAQLFKDRTLSLFYLEGLRQYLGARRELAKKNRGLAEDFREALSATGSGLVGRQQNALQSSSISEFLRAVHCLEAHAAELRGMIALSKEGSERRSAFNWFQSAVSKQQRPTMLMPPVTHYPMEVRLGDYHMVIGEPQKAARAYWAGLERRPNDLAALRGYEQSLDRLGRPEDAARIAQQIEMVKGR